MSDKALGGFGGLAHVNLDGEYAAATARQLDLIERRKRHFAGSFLFYQDPVELVRGEGAHLYDSDDRRYIDFYNNVPVVGHANPRVVRAMTEQAAKLNTHTRYLHENVIRLAETVASTLPGKLDVCLFTCTGTEAAELAMRIARVVTGQRGIIVMENSYHGNSKLVGEMSTATYAPSDRPPHIEAVAAPNTYRGVFRGDREDESLSQDYADLMDPAIERLQANGEGVAAFVCDSIFDSQGALDAPPGYFKRVYEKVRAAGGLCVADEVQAGVGRTGTYWGFEHHDVVPDIVFTGKPFGNGHPVAAVFTTREIADRWAQSDIYFNTFGGNPVSAAAAQAVFDVLREDNLLEHVKELSHYLFQRLETLQQKHSVIGRIQGRGLFVGVDLVKDRDSREPASELARRLPDLMKQQGVLIGLSGPLGNVLKFRPPLVVTREDVDRALAVFDDVLSRQAS
jgi:4-aminobutyrate aminotransferase-like enzyme